MQTQPIAGNEYLKMPGFKKARLDEGMQAQDIQFLSPKRY
jgi:hypothetical protein